MGVFVHGCFILQCESFLILNIIRKFQEVTSCIML